LDIPYVVDVGDPWALTAGGHQVGPIKRWRAVSAERRVWEGAAGAIVTTHAQAEALAALFPALQMLVRPNGYAPPPDAPVRAPDARGPGELRLVHYGSLYAPRLDLAGFAQALADSGRWRRIVLRQHGDDWDGVLRRVADHIEVEHRAAISWDQVVLEANRFDAALVLGNRNQGQLPSKAIQYLTLPIPRIAFVSDESGDSLASYVADKSAWAVVRAGDVDFVAAVAAHVDRQWQPGDFSAPAAEGWPVVENVLCDFILAATVNRVPARAQPDALAPCVEISTHGVPHHAS
jgi:hypothetical protein